MHAREKEFLADAEGPALKSWVELEGIGIALAPDLSLGLLICSHTLDSTVLRCNVARVSAGGIALPSAFWAQLLKVASLVSARASPGDCRFSRLVEMWISPENSHTAYWAKELRKTRQVQYSHFLMQAWDSLDADVAAQIEYALDVPPSSKARDRPPVDRLWHAGPACPLAE